MLRFKTIGWKYYHGGLIPDEPPHRNVVLNRREAEELLKKNHALFVRWTNNWDRSRCDYWYVIKDVRENLDDYKSKIRNQIKKSMKNCSVRQVDGNFLAQNGYEVYSAAQNSYGKTSTKICRTEFVNSFSNTGERYDYWGVFEKESDKLIGYACNVVQENMCHYSVIKLHPDFLKLYPGYALIYSMNLYYLNEKNLSYVCDGARNLYHQTNIQEFLIKKFSFRKAYADLCLHYRADLRIVIAVLFPFRRIFSRYDAEWAGKLSALLRQEEIRRNCKREKNE